MSQGRIKAMSLKYDLRGQNALVTGAGRRLGRAFAEALASCGANIAVHYGHSIAGAEETIQVAQTYGVQAIGLKADLAQAEQASSLVDQTVSELGEINLLINNAAIFKPLSFLETSIEAWNRHLTVNLTSPFLISQSFARHRGGRSGSIVNLLDWRALRPGTDHFPYTISKAGLTAMTHILAQALAPAIRVNGLALGAVLPPPGKKGFDKAIIKGVPIGRWGTVEETVDSLLFLLAGPEFITGEILQLDGGRHLT